MDMVDPDLAVDEDMEPDPALNKITNAIIGAAIAVHSELGPGHQEHVYGNALEIEFKRRGIKSAREFRFTIKYRGEKVGQGCIDFLVEDLVIVELKAVESLNSLFTAQTISYLKATGCRLALLINFNVRRLKDGIKRIAY